MAALTKEEFWAQLEQQGEEHVRISLAAKRYGDVSNHRVLAEEWLHKKDRLRNEASRAEQASAAARAVEAAERAAEAAERQASTAERATRIAMGALIVAIIAAILSLVALARGS